MGLWLIQESRRKDGAVQCSHETWQGMTVILLEPVDMCNPFRIYEEDPLDPLGSMKKSEPGGGALLTLLVSNPLSSS